MQLATVWGAVFWGSILGLVGLLYAAVSVRDSFRWLRLVRSGVTSSARITDRHEVRVDSGSGAPTPTYSITVGWWHANSDFEKTFVVDRRMFGDESRSGVEVIFDQEHPLDAMLKDRSSGVGRQLMRAAGGLAIAAAGLATLLVALTR